MSGQLNRIVSALCVMTTCLGVGAKAANLITPTNAGFETDTFTVAPGYVSGNFPITGWSDNADNRVGINPTTVSNDFGNNGVTPQGSKIAFIQSNGSATTLSQNITGLTAGNNYVLFYRENARNFGGNNANASTTLGLDTVVSAHSVAPVQASPTHTLPYYKVVGSAYTATGTSANLVFQNNTGPDSTLLVDDVRLYEYAANEGVVLNNSFEWDSFTGNGYSTDGTNGPITGWTSTSLDRTGLNPAGGSPFANNGVVPDGSKVAFIQYNGHGGALSTTVTNLVVGKTYQIDLKLNARSGFDTPNVTITAGGNTLVANTAVSPVGGANPYKTATFYYTATAATANFSVANVSTAGDATLLFDDVHFTEATPAWNTKQWTNDATSGVMTGGLYSHAYNFGSGGNAPNTTINGILFRDASGTTPANNNAQLGGDFTLGGGYNTNFGVDTNNVTGSSANLAKSFIYESSAATAGTLTLTGLLPGSFNKLSLYGVAFDPSAGRTATFTDTATNRRLTVNETANGNDNGTIINYFYKADNTGTLTIDISALGSNSYHLYGFANQVLSTAVIAGLYNTGVNDSGVALADNALDTHWRLVSTPAGAVDIAPVVAAGSAGFPIPPWLGDTSASAWITPANDTNGVPGSYTWQTTFNLDNAVAYITGRFAVDNDVTAIILNGTTLLTNPGSGFGAWINFTLDSGFVAGLNTLQFVVNNGSPTGPTGLRVEFLSASVAVVPTPGALSAGLVLMSMVLVRRRK
ncbi:MAG: hypothetical protein GC162_13180 [Planctomycetes bacterium]|nr:hypothetical protein [Planctomycetota bacterium]